MRLIASVAVGALPVVDTLPQLELGPEGKPHMILPGSALGATLMAVALLGGLR